MVAIGVRVLLAGALVAAACLKLASPRETRAALATFGLRGDRPRAVLWALLIAAELAIGAAVAVGSPVGAGAGAAWALVGAAVLAAAVRAGRAGAPCGCFGPRSRVGWGGVARNLALAAGFGVLPWLGDVSGHALLVAGVVVSLVVACALAVAVLALAREVGELRLALGPQAALEVAHEGPELGSRTSLLDRFDLGPDARIAVAVFTSDSCPLCRALEPSLALLRRDRLVALELFDEVRDAVAWHALDVPGSPYAVALAGDGTVLAKGTFNTLAQLESVLATAERRERMPLDV